VSVDPSVIAALETAIARDPENAALRVHLASLLVMAGDPQRALEHAQRRSRTSPTTPRRSSTHATPHVRLVTTRRPSGTGGCSARSTIR
jgi:protein involved in temperature-dependent protein secretion